jgi:hypothetical protein
MSKSADFHLDVPAGQAVFREGDPGQTMFIIESGVVEIFLAARGKDVVAALGPGDFFGEMAMLEDQPRFASAIALEPSRLLRIERAEFADLLRQNIEIAVRIMRKLAARHRRSEARVVEVLGEIARLRGKLEAVPVPSKPATVDSASARAPAVASRPAQPAPAAPPAPAPAAPKVLGVCLLRHAQGEVFPLDSSVAQFLVGRPDPVAGINPEINLSGVDPTRSLSRRHAKLVREGRLYFVREEVGTVNGTFVNGVRVKTGVDVPIKPGDKLRFGAVEVEFAAA